MSSAIRTIVAGVSQLTRDDPALIAAADLAREAGAALHLVHAYEVPHLHALPHHHALAQYQAELHGRLVEAVDGRFGREPVCHVVHGAPAGSILRVAEDAGADLVIVGAGSHGRLGSAAGRVLRDAEAPVLVVRRPVRRPPERVLLATDLTDVSAAAHERGLDAAAAVLGEPEAVRSLVVVGPGTLPAPLPQDALDRTARAELRIYLRARRPRPARVQAAVRAGHATEEIVAEAEAWKADLLIVGTHGHVLLGSVAEGVVRDAPCNVLAVPPARAETASTAPAPPAAEHAGWDAPGWGRPARPAPSRG